MLWKTIERDGNATKLPYQVGGAMAKSNDANTWTTFERACSGVAKYSGVGFVFSADDPFCGIDFDACRNTKTGLVDDWAKEWIVKLNSYSEVSPSQTGVKVFVRAKLPFDSGKKAIVNLSVAGKSPAVEVYDKLRYFAVTGVRLAGVSPNIEDRQAVVDELCERYFKQEPTPAPVAIPRSETTVVDRAEKYIDRLDVAIAGQGGHDKLFHVACVLRLGFGLTFDESWGIVKRYSDRCSPPWSDRELTHKLKQAEKQPGPRNYLRDAELSRWSHIPIPRYKEQDIVVPVTDTTTLHGAALEYLSALEAGTNNLTELGIGDLDFAVGGGLSKGEMVIIAARPSHGKSAFALQALDTCSANGMKGLIISEEMSQLALGKRVIQYASDTPEEHWKHQAEGVRKELDLHYSKRENVFVAENCRTTKKAVETIRWHVEHKGVEVVTVDYAQILGGTGKDQTARVSETSVALRQLANDTGIILLTLCQISRNIEGRDKFVPRSSDLKDSGQLEQDADVIIFLVWPHRINPEKPAHLYQVYVAKNRNRPINASAFNCRFFPSRQMILPEAPQPKIESKRYAEFDAFNNRAAGEF